MKQLPKVTTYHYRRLDPDFVHILQVRFGIPGEFPCESDAEEVAAPSRKFRSKLGHGVWEAVMVNIDPTQIGECRRRFR